MAEKTIVQDDCPVTLHSYMHHVHLLPFFFSVDGACADALRRGGEWIVERLGLGVVGDVGSSTQSRVLTFDFQGIPLNKQVYLKGKPSLVRILQ